KGNVRELENTVHRAVLLATGDDITPECLQLVKTTDMAAPEQKAEADDLQTLLVGRTVEDVERDLIIGTLSHCLGNRTQAAHILGISIRTLRNKIKLYTEAGVSVSKNSAYQKAI
ncbi:MAG: helix-turn-helix domain-containing protein, partial [Candidatus Nucleicultricaceae bacterium]